MGAKKLDRVKEGLKAASLIGIVYSLIAFVILFFGGKYIALLFMDADQTEIIGRVAMFLIGNSMFYIPLTFVNVVRFTIQGWDFDVCDPGRCLRDGCTVSRWLLPCSGVRIPSGMFCESACMDLCGCVPDPGFLSLYEKIKSAFWGNGIKDAA